PSYEYQTQIQDSSSEPKKKATSFSPMLILHTAFYFQAIATSDYRSTVSHRIEFGAPTEKSIYPLVCLTPLVPYNIRTCQRFGYFRQDPNSVSVTPRFFMLHQQLTKEGTEEVCLNCSAFMIEMDTSLVSWQEIIVYLVELNLGFVPRRTSVALKKLAESNESHAIQVFSLPDILE
ncbi:hypothetical protein WICPIJ_003184, partial [Wickerhamomyces pijperi]